MYSVVLTDNDKLSKSDQMIGAQFSQHSEISENIWSDFSKLLVKFVRSVNMNLKLKF